MTKKKSKPKPCKQKGLCAFYDNCKFGRDSNKCRLAADARGDDGLEVEID